MGNQVLSHDEEAVLRDLYRFDQEHARLWMQYGLDDLAGLPSLDEVIQGVSGLRARGFVEPSPQKEGSGFIACRITEAGKRYWRAHSR